MTDEEIVKMCDEIIKLRANPDNYKLDKNEFIKLVRKYLPQESTPLGELIIHECGVIKHKPKTNHKGEILLKRSQRGEALTPRPFVDNFNGERDPY
jgi:hypothetical protein